MSGCRSLTDAEVALVLPHLPTVRDKCLFILGLRTGFRISELLSLRVSDVYVNGAVPDRIRIARRNVKGRTRSRDIALHPEARAAILALISITAILRGGLEVTRQGTPSAPLFLSRNGTNKPLSRHGAHRVLKNAYSAAGLTGQLATHSMRKSFAKRVYTLLGKDLLATRDALGHVCLDSTSSYLEVNRDAIDAAVLS